MDVFEKSEAVVNNLRKKQQKIVDFCFGMWMLYQSSKVLSVYLRAVELDTAFKNTLLARLNSDKL